MTEISGSAGWPSDFCGKVRLFPLPNLVLFPHSVQPLHIFEPRYCDMLSDALASDRLIAMALLQEGWEHDYKQKPRVSPTVCVGKIMFHTPTEDGRHNILLAGMKRAKIIEELDTSTSFRVAKVEIYEDLYPEENEPDRKELTSNLQNLLPHVVPEGIAAQESFKELAGEQIPLGILTDTLTHVLKLPIAIKQQLLAEANVDIRCRILIRCLEQMLRNDNSNSCGNVLANEFPPKFSQN